MKIFALKKASGVEDFLGGVHSNRAEDILAANIPYENLTGEQKQTIRNTTRTSTDKGLIAKLFLLYPKLSKLSNYDLAAILDSSAVNKDFKIKILDQFTKYCSFDSYFFTGCESWTYQYLISNWDEVVCNETAIQNVLLEEFLAKQYKGNYEGDKFVWSSNYPAFFKRFLLEQRPSYGEAVGIPLEEIKERLLDYIKSPDNKKFKEISIAIKTLDNEEDKKNLTTSLGDLYFNSGLNVFELKNKGGEYSSMSIEEEYSEDLINVIDTFINILDSGSINQANKFNEKYSIFPFKFNSSNSKEFGPLLVPYLFDAPTSINFLRSLQKVFGKAPYISAFYQNYYDAESFAESKGISTEELTKNSHFNLYVFGGYEDSSWKLLNSDEYFKGLPQPKGSKNVFQFTEELWQETTSFGVNVKNKAYENLLSNKIVELEKNMDSEHGILNFFKTPIFRRILKEASTSLWYSGTSIGAEVISSEDIEKNKIKSLSLKQANGYPLEIINQIFGKIDPKLLFTLSKIQTKSDDPYIGQENLIDPNVIMLSGHFPCETVLENYKKKNYDQERFKDNLNCLGDVDLTRKTANEIYNQSQRKSSDDLKVKLAEGLSLNAIVEKTINDFPYVKEHIFELISTHSSDESTQKRMTDRIGNVAVYIISDRYMKNLLSFLEIKNFAYSPEKVNGFFAPYGGPLFDKPCVVVYTHEDNENNLTESVLNGLGIPSNSTELSISEENTLWHEFAHAFMNEIIPDGFNEINNVSEWMQAPSEIAAITLGNLPHIKNLIYNYFKNNLPLGKDINAGLLQQMKVDLIETFIEEFYGMNKTKALESLKAQDPDIDDDLMEDLNSQSNEEKIVNLTNMFTDFFMRKYLRGKVEDLWEEALNAKGKEEINFKELESEQVNPEIMDMEYNPLDKDKWITQLSNNPGYTVFLQRCQDQVNKAYHSIYEKNQEQFWSLYKPYVHRYSPNQLLLPTRLGDLLLLMFNAPATILNVDLNKTNPIFGNFIPQNLLSKVKEIVENERELISGQEYVEEPSMVTPDEAEELGKFIAEYGEDVMWLANRKYKIYKVN